MFVSALPLDIVEDVDLYLGALIVAFYCTDYFYCISVSLALTFQCSTKSTIAQMTNNFVASLTDAFSIVIFDMARILIIPRVG